MNFIHGTTLVHLKIRSWGGQKKASRDSDIKLGVDGKMPPKELLDLGQKKIFPPKALDPFSTIRKAAERACFAKGTRFMGGFAEPDAVIDDLVEVLKRLRDDYKLQIQLFMENMDQNLDTWFAEDIPAEHVEILRDQLPDRDVIENSFEFSFKVYKVQLLDGYEPTEEEISEQVFHETGLACKNYSKRLLERKTPTNGEEINEQLKPMIDKLDVLSFGNSRILTVLNEFQLLRKAIPMEKIEKDHPAFAHLVTFLTMCSDSEKLNLILNGTFSVNQFIGDMQRPKPVEPTSTAANSPTSEPNTEVKSAFSTGSSFTGYF